MTPPTAAAAPAPTAADLDYLAQAPDLLVAVDFDGTLAPFADDPAAVRPVPGALECLHDLAACPSTTVMLISGRTIAQLTQVTGLPALDKPGPGQIRLVGSHGAEPADEPQPVLPPERAALLAELDARATSLAQEVEGMWVERKRFSVGLHMRTAQDKDAATRACEQFASFAETHPLAATTRGKNVVEVAVDHATKGGYLERLRERLGFGSVVFLGDDVTDETAMTRLRQDRPDLGVHVVGDASAPKPWTSAAARSVPNPEAVAAFLRELAAARSAT